MTYSWLPKILAEIADVAGLDAAIDLAKARGGTEVYIPAKVNENHWLVEAVGMAAAMKICDHFTMNGIGYRVEIPFGPTGRAHELRNRLDKMIEQGKSQSEIARALGYTARNVRYRRKKLRDKKDDAQISLFETSED